MKNKLLLVDDDDDVLAALSGAFVSEGYEVAVAKNGREAIERFREGRVHLVLLDLNLPVKGGWEAFERLTTMHPLLPVVVITARPDQYPVAAAAGVAALMEKPSTCRCCCKQSPSSWRSRSSSVWRGSTPSNR